jgi:hypothetical protein
LELPVALELSFSCAATATAKNAKTALNNIAMCFIVFEVKGFADVDYSCRKHFATKGRKRVRPSSSGISRRPLHRKPSQLVRSCIGCHWNPRRSDLPVRSDQSLITNH